MSDLDRAGPGEGNTKPSPGLRGAIVRFAIFAGIVAVAVAVLAFTPLRQYLTREHLLSVMESLRAAWWSPAVLLALYLILAPLGAPMSPLMICGAVLFGPVRGTVYNFLGLLGGATLSYFFARSMGRELVVRLAGKKLKKVERFVARRGFWALVGARFLPLPFPLLNFGAALSGVRPSTFLLSSMIGMLPPTVIYTVLWHELAIAAEGEAGNVKRTVSIAVGVLLALSVLPTLISTLLRSRRYRQVLARRSER